HLSAPLRRLEHLSPPSRPAPHREACKPPALDLPPAAGASVSVALTRRAIIVEGREILFYSGEMVPFRLPRERWKDSLLKMRAAGCTAVTFYIPWNWYEPNEGAFDFDGE